MLTVFHLPRSFRSLSPRARAGVGAALLAWGFIGLQIADRAEERFGYTPSEEDREALDRMRPRIIPVDRAGADGQEKGRKG